MTTRLLILLAAVLLCWADPAEAQTIKNLGYNAANGEIVYTNTTTLTFTNNVGFAFLGAGSATGFVGRNGGTLALYGTNVTSTVPAFYGWGGFGNVAMSAGLARTNLGLRLPALTNTSNVTTMRALAGSTNTNYPFSGTLLFEDAGQNTITIMVSNGIVLEAY